MTFVGDEQHIVSQDGVDIVLSVPYSSFKGGGVTIVVVAAGLSLLCAVVLLGILAMSMWKKRSSPSEHFFVRTHAAAYFTSLMVADVIQAIGSMMSTRWIVAGGVSLGSFCSAQGAIKNAGNLAVSLWTLMLAIHTFCVLFLRMKPKDWALYVTLISVWIFVGLLVIIGPAAVQKVNRGPYFGIAGDWCWISDPYPGARIGLEYAWMFISAGVSFILYTLTFLRLRGNIMVQDGKMKLARVEAADAWQYQASRSSTDIQMTAVARGMIGFPIMFTVLILPIAICRFIAWSGKPVAFEATIFADSVFSLTGVFDFILFMTTRSLFPRNTVSLFAHRPKVSDEVKEHGFQPYNVQDFVTAHGFSEKYESQPEQGMKTLPPRTSASLTRLAMPNRPPRPLSLGALPFISPVVETRTPVQNPNRMTTRTIASQYSQDGERTAGFAWDNVDLSTSASDSFPSMPNVRDTRFTVSAYQYSNEPEEVPPMPMPISGAGIDLNAGRGHHDDDDDLHLIRSGHSRARSNDSF